MAILNERELKRFSVNKGSLNPEDYVFVRYRVSTAPDLDFDQLAVQIALSSSLGSVKALPYEDEIARGRHSALVVGVEDHGQGNAFIEIAIPYALCGSGIPHLSTVLCYPSEFVYSKEFWIESVELPRQMIAAMGGPAFGAKGILDSFHVARPLVGVITKPRLGIDFDTILAKVREALLGGADIVIDDELLHHDLPSAAFPLRLKRFTDLCREVENKTGHRKGYIPNLSGTPNHVAEQVVQAKQAGAVACQVNSFSLGFGGLADLVGHHKIGIPLIDCAIGVGLWSRPPFSCGISDVVWSFLSRLSGADGYYSGVTGSHVWYTRRSVRRTLHAITDPIGNVRPALPVGASGINPANIWDMAHQLGPESLLLSGTGILGYRDGPRIPCAAILEILNHVSSETEPTIAHEKIRHMAQHNRQLGNVLDAYGYGREKK